MILIIGQSSSGKSKYAEEIACKKGENYSCDKVYIATMESESLSSKERIKKHRLMREGKGFETIEEMHELSTVTKLLHGKVVLLECVSNLVANRLYRQCGNSVATDDIISELTESIITDIFIADEASREMIAVSVDIFSDGIIYDEWTESYLKLLANVNKKLAEKSDEVVEVICGRANRVKGIFN